MSSSSSRDLVACFLQSCGTSYSAIRAEFQNLSSSDSSFTNFIEDKSVGFSARHVIRPLSSWCSMSVASNSSSNASGGNIHLMTFQLNGSHVGKTMPFFRQPMASADVFIVALSAAFDGFQPAGFYAWIEELIALLHMIASHRSAVGGKLPPHLVVHIAPGAIKDHVDVLTARLKKSGIPHSVVGVAGEADDDTTSNICSTKMEEAQSALAKQTVGRLQSLFEERFCGDSHADPAAAAATTTSSLLLYSLGATDITRSFTDEKTTLRTVIARAARNGTLTLHLGSGTLLTHEPTNMGAVYSVKSARRVNEQMTNSCSNNNNINNDGSSFHFCEGDLLLLEMFCPTVRHPTDGSLMFPFVESQVSLCDTATEQKGAEKNENATTTRCQSKPFVFFELPEMVLGDEQQQQEEQQPCHLAVPSLLPPRFIVCKTADVDLLDQLGAKNLREYSARLISDEREVFITGFGGSARCALVACDKEESGTFVLSCTRNGKHGEMSLFPELTGGGSVTVILHVPGNDDKNSMSTRAVQVVAALRASDLTSALLDIAPSGNIFLSTLVRRAMRGATSSGSGSDASKLLDANANSNNLLPLMSSDKLRDATEVAKQQRVWWLELLTDTTFLFAFYRRASTIVACRHHAGLALTDISDQGVPLRSFISLATSLNCRNRVIALCDPGKNQAGLLQLLARYDTCCSDDKGSVFSRRDAQRMQEVVAFSEPIRSFMSARVARTGGIVGPAVKNFRLYTQIIPAMVGACCTSRWAFAVLKMDKWLPSAGGKSPVSDDKNTALTAAAAALQCGHFVPFPRRGGANCSDPPVLYQSSEFGGSLMHESVNFDGLRENFPHLPQVITRASLASRLVGGAHWAMTITAADSSKNTPSLALYSAPSPQNPHRDLLSFHVSSTKASASTHIAPMVRNIMFWTQRWALQLSGRVSANGQSFAARLPVPYAMFFVQVQRLKEKKRWGMMIIAGGSEDSIFLLSDELLLMTLEFLCSIPKPAWA